MRLWSTGTGRCLAELKGHFGLVTRVRFSPDSGQVCREGGRGERVETMSRDYRYRTCFLPNC